MLTSRASSLVALIAAGALAIGVLGTVTACSDLSPSTQSGSSGSHREGDGHSIPRLSVEVLAEHPFDTTSFTQGLDVIPPRDKEAVSESQELQLLVGTGMYQRSRIYYTTLDNQQKNSQSLPESLFGEGVAYHAPTKKIWQLTWKEGVAYLRDSNDLSVEKTVRYRGQGWGLCSDGKRLIQSDGTDQLIFRDPTTFARQGEIGVTAEGKPVTKLNELDCAPDGSVWANVWQTNQILRIDPETGKTTGIIDTSNLFPAARKPGADVLNGIAHIPGTDRFLVTGKYWDTLYEVRFVPEG